MCAIHQSNNYAAFAHRGGGVSLRHLNSGWECFFQPGDDADAFREELAALDELPPASRDTVFDMVASGYHDALTT